MPYEDYVEEIKIKSVDELFDHINGKKNIPDLRDDFIFRGIKSKEYSLIPSALRKDKDGKFIIDRYIEDHLPNLHSLKENVVLFNFLEMADKQGLKIPIPQNFREFFHKSIKSYRDYFSPWPTYDYFEAISLAQHYGIPTCALDWSYDYKIALYFATSNVLKENNKNKDCVLWAFNHKHFERCRNSIKNSKNVNLWIDENIPVVPYRPAYKDNPNLNAQKGLFTFVIRKIYPYSEKPLDKLISDELDNCVKTKSNETTTFKKGSVGRISLDNSEKIFYKFTIPHELKAKILNELYKDGYSEERIFPGYASVTKSIENKVKLYNLLEKK